MTNFSSTKFFVVASLFLISSSWTAADECKELIFTNGRSSASLSDENYDCFSHEIIVRKGNQHRYVILERWMGCSGVQFPVKFEKFNDKTLEFSAATYDTIIKVPEELGEGKVKVTFTLKNQPRNCHVYNIFHAELKQCGKNDAEVETDRTTVLVVDDIMGFTFTSYLVKFNKGMYKVVLEAPENTSLALKLVSFSGELYSEATEKNKPKGIFIDPEDAKKVNVSIYDGSRHSPVLYEFPINYAYPPYKWVFSSGNTLAFFFNLKAGQVAYLHEELFRADIYVLQNPSLDCILGIGDERCKWIEDTSSKNNSLYLSPETQTEKSGLCLSLTYDARLSEISAFYVTWETEDSSSTIYRRRGEYNNVGSTVRLQIPGSSKGKIRISLEDDKYESTLLKINSIKTRKGLCYDAEKFKHIDCRFDKTLCDWKPRSNGGYTFEKDLLILESGGKIMSPKMAAGNHCLELQLSGTKARLLVHLLKEDAKIEFRKGYAVDFNSAETRRIIQKNVPESYRIILAGKREKTPSGKKARLIVHLLKEDAKTEFRKAAETRRIILKDVPENSRIILAGKSLSYRVTGEKIKLFESKLLPIEQCIGSETLNREFQIMGNGLYGLDYPLISGSKTEFPIHTLSNTELGKWVCFRYQFHALPSLNTCLKIKVIGKINTTAWTQCMGNPEFKLGCFPLLLNQNANEVKMVAVIETSYDTTTNRTKLIPKPSRIFGTVFISEPLTNVTPSLNDPSSTWHQITNEGNLAWFTSSDHDKFRSRRFMFDTVTECGNGSGLLYSDPFESIHSNKEKVSISLNITVYDRRKIPAQSSHDPLTTVKLGLFLFEYGRNIEPISFRYFFVETSDYVKEIKHQFKLDKAKTNFYQVGLQVELFRINDITSKCEKMFSTLSYFPNYDGHIENITIAKISTQNKTMSCTVDSRYCGWNFENRLEESYDSTSKINDMKPIFDSRLNTYRDKNYVTLLSIDRKGTVQEWISAISPTVVVSNTSSVCVKFSYFVNGDDDNDGSVKLILNLVGSKDEEKKVELWSISDSQGPYWFDVQLPIAAPPNGEKEFNLEFEVSKDGSLESFFVGIDSISIVERGDCQSYDHLSDPDIF